MASIPFKVWTGKIEKWLTQQGRSTMCESLVKSEFLLVSYEKTLWWDTNIDGKDVGEERRGDEMLCEDNLKEKMRMRQGWKGKEKIAWKEKGRKWNGMERSRIEWGEKNG